MTIATVCVLVMWLLAFVPRMVLSKDMAKMPGGYDNADPRGQQAKLEGVGKRALNAHNNTLENIAPFAAGVILAMLGHGPEKIINGLALAYVVLRVAYVFLYINDKPGLRSPVWALAMLLNVALFFTPLMG